MYNKKLLIIISILAAIALIAAFLLINRNNADVNNNDSGNPSDSISEQQDTDTATQEETVYTNEQKEFTVTVPESYEYNEHLSSDDKTIFSKGKDMTDMMAVNELQVEDPDNPFNAIIEGYAMFESSENVEETEINGYKAIKVSYPATGDGGKLIIVHDVNIYVPDKNIIYQVSAIEPYSEDESDMVMAEKVLKMAESLTLKN